MIDTNLNKYIEMSSPEEPKKLNHSKKSILGPFDVLLGRDKTSHGNPGNKNFRQVVQKYRDAYQGAPMRKQKSKITHTVIESITSLGGRFLRYERTTGTYEPISQDECHEKVSHALRSARGGKKSPVGSRQSSPLLGQQPDLKLWSRVVSLPGQETKLNTPQLISTAVPPNSDYFRSLLKEQQYQFERLCLLEPTESVNGSVPPRQEEDELLLANPRRVSALMSMDDENETDLDISIVDLLKDLF